jgi:hypothetical protein
MPDETAVLPFTVKDALAAWDEGKPLRAFRVTSEGTTQDAIYAAAFELIREGDLPASARDLDGLTIIEAQSAHSIAFVALRNGWAQMVQGHIHPNSPEITIKKPA